MFDFDYYANDWADLVVSQLRTTLSTDPATWGYACICVGRELEAFIMEQYASINDASGDFFHVFTLCAPPMGFVMSRIAEAQGAQNYGLAKRLESVAKRKWNDPQHQIQYKVSLLTDLARAGLDADKYADFLFFDFRPHGEEVDIDIIAAKVAPRVSLSDPDAMLELFRELAQQATKCAALGLPAKEFVNRATWQWDFSVALTRSMKLFEFIRIFLRHLNAP